MTDREIYQGDALDLLRDFPDQSVELIVTDPPYPVISGGSNDKPRDGKGRPSGILKANDGKIFEHNDLRPSEYLPELYRVLNDPGHIYLMTNTHNIANLDIIGDIKRAGFLIHSILPWRKNNATPNRWYMKDVEFTIFARKGKAFGINNPGDRASFTAFPHPLDWDNVSSPKSHPTEKPVNLMKTYIENSSMPGATVLDPFMGTGATGVAALELGRRFVGLEVDPKYFEIAAARLGIDLADIPDDEDDFDFGL